jgi:hypothetical protein
LKKLGKYNSLKNIKSGKISLSGKNKWDKKWWKNVREFY